MSNISFYKNTADPAVVDKTTAIGSPLATLSTVKYIEPINELRPTFVFNSASLPDGVDWREINYVQLPKLNRYYYCTLTTRNDGLLQCDCEVDALFSNLEKIMNTQFEIARSASYNSEWYIDSERPIQANHMIAKVILGSIPEEQGSDKNNYVLTVAGGA